MDTSSINRSSAPVVAAPARAMSEPQTSEMPAPRAVSPAVSVELSPRAETRRRISEFEGAREMKRAFVNEPDADGLVFRISDGTTGSIILQIPSEQALKLRAYIDQAARETTVDKADTAVDIVA